jgi:hypothetical protein
LKSAIITVLSYPTPQTVRLFSRKAYSSNTRANVWGVEGYITTWQLLAIFSNQNGLCYHCGKPLDAECSSCFHVDHLKPLCMKGQNKVDNIALSCPECNREKSSTPFEQFMLRRASKGIIHPHAPLGMPYQMALPLFPPQEDDYLIAA